MPQQLISGGFGPNVRGLTPKRAQSFARVDDQRRQSALADKAMAGRPGMLDTLKGRLANPTWRGAGEAAATGLGAALVEGGKVVEDSLGKTLGAFRDFGAGASQSASNRVTAGVNSAVDETQGFLGRMGQKVKDFNEMELAPQKFGRELREGAVDAGKFGTSLLGELASATGAKANQGLAFVGDANEAVMKKGAGLLNTMGQNRYDTVQSFKDVAHGLAAGRDEVLDAKRARLKQDADRAGNDRGMLNTGTRIQRGIDDSVEGRLDPKGQEPFTLVGGRGAQGAPWGEYTLRPEDAFSGKDFLAPEYQRRDQRKFVEGIGGLSPDQLDRVGHQSGDYELPGMTNAGRADREALLGLYQQRSGQRQGESARRREELGLAPNADRGHREILGSNVFDVGPDGKRRLTRADVTPRYKVFRDNDRKGQVRAVKQTNPFAQGQAQSPNLGLTKADRTELATTPSGPNVTKANAYSNAGELMFEDVPTSEADGLLINQEMQAKVDQLNMEDAGQRGLELAQEARSKSRMSRDQAQVWIEERFAELTNDKKQEMLEVLSGEDQGIFGGIF